VNSACFQSFLKNSVFLLSHPILKKNFSLFSGPAARKSSKPIKDNQRESDFSASQ
jgi:hypothetical protein